MRNQINDRMTNEGSVLRLCSTSKPVHFVPGHVALSVLSGVNCPKLHNNFMTKYELEENDPPYHTSIPMVTETIVVTCFIYF